MSTHHLLTPLARRLLHWLEIREERASTRDLCTEWPDNQPKTLLKRMEELQTLGLVTFDGHWDISPESEPRGKR